MFFGKYLIFGMAIGDKQINVVSAGIQDIPGLVSYYTGNNNLQDSTGVNGLVAKNGNAAAVGGATYETVQTLPFSSIPRAVFELNGTTGRGYHLRAPATGVPVGDADRTIMGWVRIDKVSSSSYAIMFGYGGYRSRSTFDFVCQSNFKVHLDITTYGDDNVNPISDYTNDFGVWKHYALTYDSPTVKSYVNGVLATQGDFTAGPLITLSEGIFIGGGFDPDGRTFYGAAAEIAIFNRALTAEEINTAATLDTAGGGGDPHFFGFGGLFFTWQGHCDVILVKTPKVSNTETGVDIHIRTRRVRKWSAIDTLAFKVGHDVGEIGSGEGKLMLNGIEVKSIQTDSLTVVKSLSTSKKSTVVYEIVFNKNKILEVKVNIRTKMIYTTLSGAYPHGTVGLLGSPHAQGLYARDGVNMTDKDVNKFVESWQVRETDPSLFHVNRKPQYPEKCVYKVSEAKADTHSRRLKEVHSVSTEEAAAACAIHRAGPLKAYCIEDVTNTGDLDSAKDTFYG